MDRKSHDGLATIVADTERLRQQLRELHADVKARADERREQAGLTVAVGMVIKGK